MKIRGYLERGTVNSLFFEMKYAEEGNKLMDEFISSIEIPKYHLDFRIIGASI